MRGLLCALVVCATALVHASMNTASAAASGRLRVPTPERARALALGFEPVIADYYWIQALELVGDAHKPPNRNQTIGELIDVVTGLDPWVDHPYRFAALWLSDNADEVRHANRLLEKGIAYHPRDWRNHFYLGYNYFFYLDDNASAADSLERAMRFPEAPLYLGSFVTRLRALGDSLDTATLFLQSLIAQSRDEYERAAYLEVLAEVETERRAQGLDRAREEFRKRNGRDIRKPSELWAGPLRILRGEPPAHPEEKGSRWQLDPQTGEIVSSFYGRRYRLHLNPAQDDERRAFRGESSSPAPAASGGRS